MACDSPKVGSRKDRQCCVTDGLIPEFVYQNALQPTAAPHRGVIVSDDWFLSTVFSDPLEKAAADTHTQLRFYGAPLTLAVPVPHENALTHRAVSLVWNRHPQKFGQLDHLLKRITTKGITSVCEFSSAVNQKTNENS